jgi:hypothetical protein
MSDTRDTLAPPVTSMSALPNAVAAQDTDEFLVCQKAGGCGPTDPLARMSMAQVSDYILSKGNTGIVGLVRAVDLSVVGDTAIPLTLPPGTTACVLTGAYLVKPSGVGTGTCYGGINSGPNGTGVTVFSMNSWLPNSGSIAKQQNNNTDTYSFSGALYFNVNTPEPSPVIVDLYIIGFPLL